MNNRLAQLREPCLTIDQCAEALKMEALGHTSGAIANSFGVLREHLIITMQHAKEYGFIYFQYHGPLIDHMQTLRAIGAKRRSHGIREKFCALTGLKIAPSVFSVMLNRVRPYL